MDVHAKNETKKPVVALLREFHDENITGRGKIVWP
jgi:hypothetical protein